MAERGVWTVDLLRLAVFCVASCTPFSSTQSPVSTCGDNVCDGSEKCGTCATDCGECPPDGSGGGGGGGGGGDGGGANGGGDNGGGDSGAGGGDPTVDSSTLDKKIMAGYQGWFMASGDGSGAGWRHWVTDGNKPDTDNLHFDFWPDLREYDVDELFDTNLKYRDNADAGVYSAYSSKTADRHVKWMMEYGIDGVFVQRFISEAVKMTSVRDRVLDNVRKAAEKYGRVFANMYDGWDSDDTVSDWKHLVDDERITESESYLHHNGRPVLAIWGFGFSHREDDGTAGEAADLVEWLTETAPERYRVTLMGGIDDDWRTHDSDWVSVYRSLDIISPWTVGRYGSIDGADGWIGTLQGDIAECRTYGIDYLPVVFPGFSWYNLHGGKFNQIPREGGNFLWTQFHNAIAQGSNMLYVAMYDEVDEGTAIYKVAENASQVPTDVSLVTLDADGYELPSDWYLRLTGEASKMLRGEIGLTKTIPISP